MSSMSSSKLHLRLVKKLPGQPPAGAIVPVLTVLGALPNVMTQAPPAAADNFHFPARSTGGGTGGGGGGDGSAAAAVGGGAAVVTSGPPKREVLVQAASAASTSKSAAPLTARHGMRAGPFIAWSE